MCADWLTGLLVLQDRDLKCDSLRKQIESVPNEIAKEEKAIEKERERLKTAAEELQRVTVEREATEGEIESLEEAVRRFKTQQMEVRKNEEYTALEHEIAHHQSKISDLEDRVLALMDDIEFKDQEKQRLETEVNERIAALENHIQTLREGETNAGKELTEAEAALEEAKTQVDPEVLRDYAFTKTQVKRGPYVVQLSGGTRCSGCHLKVSGEVEATARKGKTRSRCDNCGRIVYYQP